MLGRRSISTSYRSHGARAGCKRTSQSAPIWTVQRPKRRAKHWKPVLRDTSTSRRFATTGDGQCPRATFPSSGRPTFYGRRWAASSSTPSRRITPRRGLSTSSTVYCRAGRSLKVRRDEPGRSRTHAWAPLSAPPSAVSSRSIRWAWASAPHWVPRGAHPSTRVAQRRPRPSGASMRTTLAS